MFVLETSARQYCSINRHTVTILLHFWLYIV